MKGIVAARGIVMVIEEEAARNPGFNRRLRAALAAAREKAARRRRSPPALDAMRVVKAEGRDGLRARLEQLTLEQLRDIVSHGCMGPVAMRWKNRARVIDRIVERAYCEAHKGEAFLNRPPVKWPPLPQRRAA